MMDRSLEDLRNGNPAARSLPLLAAIARGGVQRVVLEYLEDQHVPARDQPVSLMMRADIRELLPHAGAARRAE